LARPGGNTTGFTLFEYGISGRVEMWRGSCRPNIICSRPFRLAVP